MLFNGIEVIENESNLFVKGYNTYPKRKNKNKRIQKKWNKIYGFYSVPIPDDKIYVFNGKLIGHPKTIKKLLKKTNVQEFLKHNKNNFIDTYKDSYRPMLINR